MVQARWLSSKLLLCPSPVEPWVLANTSVSLFVTNNGADFQSNPDVKLTVVSRTATFALEPSHGSTAGGTELSIFSHGMPFSGTAYCRFDRSVQVVATIEAAKGVLRCFTPA